MMQTMLHFPGDFFDLLTESYLSLQQVAAHPRAELIGPGRFDKDASQMRVAHFGDASTDDSGTTGILAGDNAAIAHQLSGSREAGNLTELSNDSGGRNFGDTAQRLQRFNDRPHAGRSRASGLS